MLQLHALIEGLPLRLERGSEGLALRDLVEDSRRAGPGCAFLAREGEQADGRRFIADAIERGATAIITDIAPPADLASPLPGELAWVRAERADTALAATLAERFFGHPSRDLRLIGVTGTNGKTTTATLIQHLLTAAGIPTGLIGTLGATLPASTGASNKHQEGDGQEGDNDEAEVLDTGMTTPGPIEFSRILALMRDRGCRAAVTEVSSHALDQGRAGALAFRVGVFTNLTGDHLDYHGTMDAYADAKARLFALLGEDGWAVVNIDDSHAERMLESFAGPAAHVLRCTVRDGQADAHGRSAHGRETVGFREEDACRAVILSLAAHGSRARFDGPWGSVEATLPLVGRHNIANALQAVAAAHAVVDLSPCLAQTLASCPPVPGRLERVVLPDESSEPLAQPAVLVDYAHTHDALENVLLALRPLAEGRLRVVFGCGGDRDREKRPKMAQVAARFADEIWVTSDNPRTEDPQRIIDDIVKGFATGHGRWAMSETASASGTSDIEHQTSNIHIEPDRAKAIAAAVRDAEPTDTVLIAGKGHEDYQILADRTIHFDDREQAAAALRQWRKEHAALWPPTR